MLGKVTGGMEKMKSCLESVEGNREMCHPLFKNNVIHYFRSAEQSRELSSVEMGRITSYLHLLEVKQL